MHDPGAVGVLEAVEDLHDQVERHPRRGCPLVAHPREQVAVGHQGGDQVEAAVELTVVVHGHHVGALDAGERLRLPAEARAVVLVGRELRGDDLERDLAVQGGVERGVHDPHAAVPQHAQQAVAAEVVPDRGHPDHVGSRGGRWLSDAGGRRPPVAPPR